MPLQYMHKKGFLHNVVKANNIIIQQQHVDELHPAIIDFGKSQEILKVRGYKRGTEVDYIAPRRERKKAP